MCCFCLRCDLGDWLSCGALWAASGRSACGYALSEEIAAAPKVPARIAGLKHVMF